MKRIWLAVIAIQAIAIFPQEARPDDPLLLGWADIGPRSVGFGSPGGGGFSGGVGTDQSGPTSDSDSLGHSGVSRGTRGGSGIDHLGSNDSDPLGGHSTVNCQNCGGDFGGFSHFADAGHDRSGLLSLGNSGNNPNDDGHR